MYNINQVMKKDYRPALYAEANSSYKLKLLIVGIKVICVQLYDYILLIIKFFTAVKPENISKKLALVTGGANGLGRSISFRLAQEGCDLAIVDIDYKAACQTAKEIAEKFKVNCRPYHCDVSDKIAIFKLKSAVESEMRAVDILVNNAGLVYISNYLTADVDDIERTIKVNLMSQMLMTRIFLTGMIERKYGRIMSICSITSIVEGPTMAAYTATKKGVDGFMKALSNDILMTGNEEFVKLTTVYPDFMHTRDEIRVILDAINHFMPRLSPDRVADDAIKGMKVGKEFVFACDIMYIYYALKFLTNRSKKYISTAVIDGSVCYNS